MLEKLSAWKSFNKYTYISGCFSWHCVNFVIWFWQLNSATNTSKCHHSALTFHNFPGQNPRTPRNNVAPSALVGHGSPCPTETPLLLPPIQTVCLHIISTQLRHWLIYLPYLFGLTFSGTVACKYWRDHRCLPIESVSVLPSPHIVHTSDRPDPWICSLWNTILTNLIS